MTKTERDAAPHDLNAERALLGAAMLDTAALTILATETRPEDFYAPAHGHIAAALVHHFERDLAVDVVTIADSLKRRGLLDTVGGHGALAEIMAATPVVSAATRYAQIVLDHAVKRRLQQAAAEIDQHARNGHDAHDAVTAARELIDRVAASNGRRTYSTLNMADIEALLRDGLPQEQPAFLTRLDGQRLLYAGRMHVFQGEPGCGKSWLSLYASTEILDVGGTVLYLDYEDTPRGIVGRLLALGADPAALIERFRYVRPEGDIGGPERIELEGLLRDLNPDLVIIDGVAEALQRGGYDEDKAGQVADWVEKFPRWIARSGVAVLMIDHVSKDKEKRGSYQRGSGHKKAVVDGAAYEIIAVEHFSRSHAGTSHLKIAKDRPGGVGPERSIAAVASIEPHGDGTRVVMRLDAPTEESTAFRPTRVMVKISDLLEHAGEPLSAAVIIERLPDNNARWVRKGINNLLGLGCLREVRDGRARLLELVRVYSEDDPRNPPPPKPPRSKPVGLFDDTDPGDDGVVDLDEWKRRNF